MSDTYQDRDIVFVYVESLGIERAAPIWEFAAMRFSHDGVACNRNEFFIHHEQGNWLATLPQSFREDYEQRYNPASAYSKPVAASVIATMTRDAIVIGCNPGFDVEHLGDLLRSNGVQPTWHYHPLDIASICLGYLAAKGVTLPTGKWKSDLLALAAADVDAARFARHTAMGDVDWAIAQWAHIFDGAQVELWRHLCGGAV